MNPSNIQASQPRPTLLTRLGEALSRLDRSHAASELAAHPATGRNSEIPGANDHYESALPSSMFDRSMRSFSLPISIDTRTAGDQNHDFP